MDIVNATPDCPFCAAETGRSLLIESDWAFAILDRYPVNPGHALVIPKYHVADYFQLPAEYQLSCWTLLNQLKELIAAQFQPDGFNIGVNIHAPAGQTVPHVHIHLIPRYHGDLESPRGGVRGVIPHKRGY